MGAEDEDVKGEKGVSILRICTDRELAEGEVLELSGDVLLTECTLDATWGGTIKGRDACIVFEQSEISGNVSEHIEGVLDFDNVRFQGSAPEGESLISIGASMGRFRRCRFEDVSGTALTADFLGSYPPQFDETDADRPALAAPKLLGALLQKGGVHASVHLALESCEFRNCRATGELAAPIELLRADTMHTSGLVLFRDCTFESCAGTVGIVYVQDVSISDDDSLDRWPLRAAFVNCRFVNCARLEKTPEPPPLTPRIVLQHCEFVGCRAEDLFHENIDELDEMMEEVLRNIMTGNI